MTLTVVLNLKLVDRRPTDYGPNSDHRHNHVPDSGPSHESDPKYKLASIVAQTLIH